MNYLTILFSLFFLSHTNSDFMEAPPRPGSPNFIRLEITLMDNADTAPPIRIVSATFDNRDITIRPPNPTLIRGKLHAQVYPGTHYLSWTIKKTEDYYSTQETHNHDLQIDEGHPYIQILISGDSLQID